MADNIFGSVTFDSFGARIPTDNLALRVQHKDRVVLDSVQEYLIFFLAASIGDGMHCSSHHLIGLAAILIDRLNVFR